MQKILGLMAGAGGFGGEVLSWLDEQANKDFDQVFLIDDSPAVIAKQKIWGLPIISFDEFSKIKNVELYFNVLIGDSFVRAKLWKRFTEQNIKPVSFFSTTTQISRFAEIGQGAVFCQNTTVTSNSKIGVGFQCHVYSYTTHDCIIGDFVTFAPRVCCNGNVHIGNNVYVGTNASIKQGTPEKPLIIGDGAIIGMGAVVTKDVKPNETVVGNPAKPIKR